jgi:hypothetical protein
MHGVLIEVVSQSIVTISHSATILVFVHSALLAASVVRHLSRIGAMVEAAFGVVGIQDVFDDERRFLSELAHLGQVVERQGPGDVLHRCMVDRALIKTSKWPFWAGSQRKSVAPMTPVFSRPNQNVPTQKTSQ